jgi:hypothetical protein
MTLSRHPGPSPVLARFCFGEPDSRIVFSLDAPADVFTPTLAPT